jgi:hypothetical protein
MEAALKKLFAIALLAAFASTTGTALAAKKARQAPPPPDNSGMYGPAPAYGEVYGPAPGYSGYGPLIDVPVALPYGATAYPAFGGCTTDEGYGRRGSCDTGVN